MRNTVIRVVNIGKKYHLGCTSPLDQISFSLKQGVTAPLYKLIKGDQSGPSASEFWALKDVSFEVERGSVLGVIGRNGAGKSTLLKILSKITTPTKGHIDINGRVGSLLEVGTGFHPELTGRENIYLSGVLLGMKKFEIEENFDEIVRFSEIEKFLDTPVKRYSSGMYVRLAFAVAAHLKPEILLVDEVLAVGDAAFQKKCLGKMGSISHEGRTIVFVSHNMSAVQRLCNSAILLHKGRIIDKGDVNEVTESYLRKGYESSSYWERLCSPENEVYFNKIYLADESGNHLSFVSPALKVNLIIDFTIEKYFENLQLAINITNIYGEPVFASSPEDIGVLTPKEVGLYRAVVTLPTELFLAKNYGITVSLYLPMQRGLDHVDSLYFTVQEIDCWSNKTIGGRRGDLAIPCNWLIRSTN
jgi:lipopolysaccharide transport system ATP-binding protein